MGMFDWLGKAIGGIGKLFGGSSGASGASLSSMTGSGAGGISQAAQGFSGLSPGGGWGNALKSAGGGISNLFGGGSGMAGLGMMGLGSMIPNAKTPEMPAEFKNYMGMLNQGGTPGMQSANQYYQGVLSGQNQGAYDAATSSIDDTYDEEVRKLTSMYKSLRPGTDPTTDSTYQRDLSQLQGNYAKQRALAAAGVQQGAAAGAAGLGGQLANMQGGAIQQYVDQIATQWGMNQSQRQALRDSIMGLGGKMVTGPMDMANQMNWFKMMQEMAKSGAAGVGGALTK